MIQRWKVSASGAAFGGKCTAIIVTEPDGDYVTYADHLAYRAELVAALETIRDKGGKEFTEDEQIVEYDGIACAEIAKRALEGMK